MSKARKAADAVKDWAEREGYIWPDMLPHQIKQGIIETGYWGEASEGDVLNLFVADCAALKAAGFTDVEAAVDADYEYRTYGVADEWCPDYTRGGGAPCDAQRTPDGLTCTRTTDHTGRHAAGTGDHIIGVWS